MNEVVHCPIIWLSSTPIFILKYLPSTSVIFSYTQLLNVFLGLHQRIPSSLAFLSQHSQFVTVRMISRPGPSSETPPYSVTVCGRPSGLAFLSQHFQFVTTHGFRYLFKARCSNSARLEKRHNFFSFLKIFLNFFVFYLCACEEGGASLTLLHLSISKFCQQVVLRVSVPVSVSFCIRSRSRSRSRSLSLLVEIDS